MNTEEHQEYLYKEAFVIAQNFSYRGTFEEFKQEFSYMIYTSNLERRNG